jgi:hypothetical protein
VNLYAGATADIKLDNGRTIKLTQETRYPWDGAVKLTVVPDRVGLLKTRKFTINLRIPGWARNEAVPSDLYTFVDKVDEPLALKVNGQSVPIQIKKGYASLSRAWKAGDVIELNLPMPVRRVAANANVRADRGRIALQRGPLVYCAEWPDSPGGHVRNLMLPDDEKLAAEFEPALLNGVEIIKGRAYSLAQGENGQPVKTAVDFKAVPYYAWANRGRGEMMVWFPNSEQSASVLLRPTIASTSRVTVSGRGTNPQAINDQMEPSSSGDEENPFFHWWPRKGTKEWVQYDLAKPARVSAVEVYWFDDTDRGECRLPKSWQLFYRENAEWKLVKNASAFGCAPDRYNRATFDPVETDGLRLEVQFQEGWSAGIQEWRVE